MPSQVGQYLGWRNAAFTAGGLPLFLLLRALVDLLAGVAHRFDGHAVARADHELGAIGETPDVITDARALRGIGRPDLRDELIVRWCRRR